MSGPGFTQPDLCSIRAAVGLAKPARAVRGLYNADGFPLADDARSEARAWWPAVAVGGRRQDDDRPRAASGGYRATAASGIDRAIRLSTAAAVLAVAGIAAYVSYWHAYAVLQAHGESGITARLEPATIDGLVYASSMVVLYAARHRVPVPPLARWLLGLGIAATLTANMAQGWSHGPVGAVAAYRLSAQAGNPLSERKLAQMFGRTSRRWARARIAEARRAPSPGLAAMKCASSLGTSSVAR